MYTTPAFLGIPTALEHDDLTSLIDDALRHPETFLSFGIGLWVSGGSEWQESVTARADYAATLDASSKMPMNLASAQRPPRAARP
jgi:hypothetical protein